MIPRRLATTTALFAILAAPALAADLPMVPPPIPVFVPPPLWTGIYIGAHAGYGTGEVDAEVEYLNTNVDCCAREDGVRLDDSFDTDGFLGGGQIGYNYQVGRFVFGAEADLSWTDMDGDRSLFDTEGDFGEARFDIDWLGTVRGRFGVANEMFLLYATGGVAFAGVEASLDYAGDPYDANDYRGVRSDDDTRVGWTIGAGLEGFITPNITARIEYLYVDLGDEDDTFFDNDCFNIKGESQLTSHVVRAGLNYKFLW